MQQHREVVSTRVGCEPMIDADAIERLRLGAVADGNDGDAVVVQRTDELPVEPRQLSRDHRNPGPVALRHAEQLAVVHAAPDELDAQLPPLQPSNERRLPPRTAGAGDDAHTLAHGSCETSNCDRAWRAAPFVARTTSSSPLRTANATKTTSSGCDGERQRRELAFALAEEAVGVDHRGDAGHRTRP